MSTQLDLTMPEGPGVEYKGAESLKALRDIVRAVAAMLNAGGGGTIWIGVREQAERPTEVEGVRDIVAARRRVEDALCDSLEPPWSSEVGKLEECSHAEKDLLAITCGPEPVGGPFAVLEVGWS